MQNSTNNRILAIQSKYLQELDQMRDSINIHKESLDSLWSLHPYLNKQATQSLYAYMQEYRYCPGTNFLVAKQVDPKVHMDLYEAMLDYTGPPVSITSMRRDHSHGSLHAQGKAIDIRWNENAKLMARWLLSEEGRRWIECNNLKIYFENIPEPEYRRGEFKRFYMHNPHATAPHIHIGKSYEV